MSAPRIEVDLDKIEANAGSLVDRLGRRGIRVVAVTKALLGAPELGAALERGGVSGLGDSRVQNLARLRAGGSVLPRTLIRSPMLSDAHAVARDADISLNSEARILDALSAAAGALGVSHGVVLMVELGDLREGISPRAVVKLARLVEQMSSLDLLGLGTNLACQSGIAPDESKMDHLSALVEEVESTLQRPLAVVSGGNSANLGWATSTADVGRINELRLGESILLGTEPLHRTPVDGLHTDACVLVAEVIEVQTKPSQPWGVVGQAAFGTPPPRTDVGSRRQALLAVGHQDVDPLDLVPPPGCVILGASSDHLVVDVSDVDVALGDELAFAPGYSALVRSMTSPFVAKQYRSRGAAPPA